MQRVLSVDNMRKSDANCIATKTPSKELMYMAGKGIYDVICERVFETKAKGTLKADEISEAASIHVGILCGSGNNAGDGYVVAGLLKQRGVRVTLFLCSEKFSDDGKYYYDKLFVDDEGMESELIQVVNLQLSDGKSEVVLESLKKCKVVVDCLLGTGFSGTPREPYKSLIEYVNALHSGKICNQTGQKIYVISADINSGLNGDNGLAETCIESDITVSIGDRKPGLYLGMAKDVIGEIVNVPIGIDPIEKPYYLFEAMDVAESVKPRKNHTNKGTYGYIGLIGGSYRYGGAITLAGNANAAMRSGAGVVMIAAPHKLCDSIRPRILESTLYPLSEENGDFRFVAEEIDELMSRTKLLCVGMGIGQSDNTTRLVEYLLNNYDGTLIIDADGLNCLSKLLQERDEVGVGILGRAKPQHIILTPHIKEFSRLTGKSIRDLLNKPIMEAVSFAREHGIILLLKGETTIITDGDNTYLVDRGCPGMATAGSGDVLSGVLSAICGVATVAERKGLTTEENGLSVERKELTAEQNGQIAKRYGMFEKEYMTRTVAAGAYINGLAGELAEEKYGDISMIASDTIEFLPEAIRSIRAEDIS